jgi:hypothetical protein
MEPDSEQGESVDRFIKISNWPQAVVAVAGLFAAVGAFWAMLSADVPFEVAVGAVMTILGLSGGQLAIARRAASTEAKTDRQTQQLTTIVKQTNGMSEAERRTIAEEAADLAAVAVIAAYNRGELGGPRTYPGAAPVPGRNYLGDGGPEILDGGQRG